MPNRILREGILTSPRIAKLGWAEEVFYRRMHSVVDDFGRYFADVGLLRAACYPRQLNKVSDSDVGKWLRVCVDAALVRVYRVEDEDYLLIVDFNQQVRAKKSKFPDVPSTRVADAQQVPANAHLDEDVSVFGGVDDLDPTGLVDREAANLRAVPYEIPDCPFEDIGKAFAELLPMLPQLAGMTDQRKSHVRARWKQVCAAEKFTREQGIAWFRDFFGLVAASKFLIGQGAPKRDTGKPWNATFDWLMNPENFMKVVEGNYERKAA